MEELIERYKDLNIKNRMIILILAAMLPTYYYWTGEGDTLQEDLEIAEQDLSRAERSLNKHKGNSAKLPELNAKIANIQVELEKAKKILPDRVFINKTLAHIGKLEKDYQVKVNRFEPGAEVQPNPDIDYKELPIDLEISGQFPQVMRFFDSLVHLQYLTHLRDVLIERQEVSQVESAANVRTEVVARTKLILFKGL